MKDSINYWHNFFYSPQKTKIVVLGMQKSGTTAVASLLSIASNLKYSSDPLYHIDYGVADEVGRLFSGQKTLHDIIVKYNKLFGCSIVKDPDFIYFYDQLISLYTNASYIFIVRNPFDTIKSICGRLGLVGYMLSGHEIPSNIEMNNYWRGILKGHFPQLNNFPTSSLVFNLATRWNLATEIYIKHANNIHLIRYEDFLSDKVGTIIELLDRCRVEYKNKIDSHINKRFQISGGIKEDAAQYFGEESFSLIKDVCGPGMKFFGYNVWKLY